MNDSSNTLVIDAFWADSKSFPSEISPTSPEGKILYQGYHGDFTHLGWMDLVQLKEKIKSQNISEIVVKNLDLLGKVVGINGNLKICNCYVYNNSLILRSTPKDGNFENYHPIYDTIMIGGWSFSEDDEEIPIRAKVYLQQLAFHTNVQITYINKKVKVTAYFAGNPYPKLRCEKIQQV